MMYKERFIAVIKHNGKVLRERGDVVKLPFGSEYSVMLKNLESSKAVVKVSVDGEDVLDGHSIIVQPNSELELGGFMKGMSVRNKFKFIQKTKEISEHRGDRLDDGIVRVEFQFEKKHFTKIVEEEKVYTYPRVYWDYRCPLCGTWPCTCPKWYFHNPNQWSYSGGDSSAYYLNNSGGSAGLSCSSGPIDATFTCSNMSMDNTEMDTPTEDEGITVKGSETKQDFTYGSTRELEEDSSVIVIRLRGSHSSGAEVKKPVTVKSKLTCPTCGRKSKSSVKYCGNCGTYLG